jgi:hypothetical protein
VHLLHCCSQPKISKLTNDSAVAWEYNAASPGSLLAKRVACDAAASQWQAATNQAVPVATRLSGQMQAPLIAKPHPAVMLLIHY